MRAPVPTLDEAIRIDRAATRRFATGDGRTRLVLARANGLPTWAVVASLLMAAGPRGRRASVAAGVAALSGSSVARLAIKPMVARPRPAGAHRRSPSFPSGHATTGTAFATATALEWPAAGVVTGAISVIISVGRVRDGQHHVLDVISGAALGAAVAIATRPVATRIFAARPGDAADRARAPTGAWAR